MKERKNVCKSVCVCKCVCEREREIVTREKWPRLHFTQYLIAFDSFQKTKDKVFRIKCSYIVEQSVLIEKIFNKDCDVLSNNIQFMNLKFNLSFFSIF